jgi:hypothetical protein
MTCVSGSWMALNPVSDVAARRAVIDWIFYTKFHQILPKLK